MVRPPSPTDAPSPGKATRSASTLEDDTWLASKNRRTTVANARRNSKKLVDIACSPSKSSTARLSTRES